MSYITDVVGSLTIANGGSTSGLLSSVLSEGQMKVLGSAAALSIKGPAALTGAVTVEVAQEYPGTSWTKLQRAGSDVAIGAADTVDIENPMFRDLRLVSAGTEGAERVFGLMAKLHVD